MRGLPRLPVLLLPALASCGTLGPPGGATEQGRAIRALWDVFFWVGVGVAAVVYGLILWSVVRYRRRSDELPPQVRVNIPLEIAYTLIPVLIVGVLFALTYRTESRVGRLVDDPALTVHVQAFNWSWRFDYEDRGVSVFGTPEDPPELVLPAGRTVRLRLTATDVIHSLYVPEFLFKRDAIPGHPNEFDISIDEPGSYTGQCAEFCGLDHARMRFTIRALPPTEFDRWLERASLEGAAR
ncbi:MAG: cytochrome c oxidase subunit II [Actinomycetota bacterium]